MEFFLADLLHSVLLFDPLGDVLFELNNKHCGKASLPKNACLHKVVKTVSFVGLYYGVPEHFVDVGFEGDGLLGADHGFVLILRLGVGLAAKVVAHVKVI